MHVTFEGYEKAVEILQLPEDTAQSKSTSLACTRPSILSPGVRDRCRKQKRERPKYT